MRTPVIVKNSDHPTELKDSMNELQALYFTQRACSQLYCLMIGF